MMRLPLRCRGTYIHITPGLLVRIIKGVSLRVVLKLHHNAKLLNATTFLSQHMKLLENKGQIRDKTSLNKSIFKGQV